MRSRKWLATTLAALTAALVLVLAVPQTGLAADDTTATVAPAVTVDPVPTAKAKLDALSAEMRGLLGPAYASQGAKDNLLDKLNTASWAVASGSYVEAVNILRADVLPRLDGCQSRDRAGIDDAVVLCELQKQYYATVSDVATLLASTGVASAVSSEVSATLTAGGGWVAYTFDYAGDNSKLGLLLTYSPARDPYGETSPVLQVFGPTSALPGGIVLGTAGQLGDTWGATAQRYVQIQSGEHGTYTVLLQNWDGLGRALNFSLRTIAVDPKDTNDDVRDDPPGPALTFVASGS